MAIVLWRIQSGFAGWHDVGEPPTLQGVRVLQAFQAAFEWIRQPENGNGVPIVIIQTVYAEN